jgi:hypothetical protein
LKKIIVTCDDCGLSEGINLAALQLHEAGIATAASVMSNFPAVTHAARLFADSPAFEMGAHLNLTDGCAVVLPRSSRLTRADGHFRSRYNLFARALVPTPAFLAQVEVELGAQVQRLVDLGLRPRHLSTHIHFHFFPSLRRVVFKLARQFDVEWVRTWDVRHTVLQFNPLLHGRPGSSCEVGAIRVPDYLLAVGMWLGKLERVRKYLATLQGNVEVVVHPSLPEDATFPGGVRYLPYQRFVETSFIRQVYQNFGGLH